MVGTQVYATSAYGTYPRGSVIHFTTDLAGNLTFAGCIGDKPGCTPTSPATAFADSAAVTNDGAHMYVASIYGNTVSHFTIAGPLRQAHHLGHSTLNRPLTSRYVLSRC